MAQLPKSDFKVPSRPKLEVFEQKKQKVKEKLANCNASLALDGWSNLVSDRVIGISITTSCGIILINTIELLIENKRQ